MHKAKKKDAPRQDRRKRAFDRLTFRPVREGESATDYTKYCERKAIETAALKRSLGLP